jgi:hypothetical protein
VSFDVASYLYNAKLILRAGFIANGNPDPYAKLKTESGKIALDQGINYVFMKALRETVGSKYSELEASSKERYESALSQVTREDAMKIHRRINGVIGYTREDELDARIARVIHDTAMGQAVEQNRNEDRINANFSFNAADFPPLPSSRK